MNFVLPSMPYAYDALEPHISKAALELHHTAHQAAYVNKANELVKDTVYYGQSLESVIDSLAYSDDAREVSIRNNCLQILNHTFFWHSLSPTKTAPSKELEAQIVADFGDMQKLIQELKAKSLGQFGSGWGWLMFDKGLKKLRVMNGGNAYAPVQCSSLVALLNVDVWEHAYYVDYKNKRGDYLESVLNNVLNWKFASDNFNSALK